MISLDQANNSTWYYAFKTMINTSLSVGAGVFTLAPLSHKDTARGYQILLGVPFGLAAGIMGGHSLYHFIRERYFQGNYSPLERQSYQSGRFDKTLRLTEQVSAICAIASAVLPFAFLMSND